MKSFQEIVCGNVEKNFAAFKARELEKSKEKIFCDAYEINFYNEMHDYFADDYLHLDDKVYEFLAKDGETVLDRLRNFYINDWERSIADSEDASQLVTDYYETYESERGGEMGK